MAKQAKRVRFKLLDEAEVARTDTSSDPIAIGHDHDHDMSC